MLKRQRPKVTLRFGNLIDYDIIQAAIQLVVYEDKDLPMVGFDDNDLSKFTSKKLYRLTKL